MNNKLYFEILNTMKAAKSLLLDLAQTAHCEDLPIWNKGFEGYETVEELTSCIDKMEKGEVY